MRYKPCGNVLCSEIIDANKFPAKKYCSNACKQEAYRHRVKVKNRNAKVTLNRYCVNCGRKFTTTRIRQQFHNESCRSSFWQQQQRLKLKEQAQMEAGR